MNTTIVAIASLIAFYASESPAQKAVSVSADQPDAGANAGDIVVTAQKREQHMFDVPIAISAYDSRFLNQIGANELVQVSAITPGLVIQLQDKFSPGLAIRGITSGDIDPQSEQRVAVFQDGVPVTQMQSAYGEMFDIDRIEIEKGPQSTLHGRSALNGGISIFQKRPTRDFGFDARGSLGTYDYRHAQGVLNLPLTSTLGVRVGAMFRQRDGFVDDNVNATSFNALNARAYRLSSSWTPSNDFAFHLVATYDVDRTRGGVPFKSRTFLPLDQRTGLVSGDLNFWTPTSLRTFGALPPAHFNRKILGLSGTTEIALTDRLNVTSISGYRWFDTCQSGDSDGTTTDIVGYLQCNRGRQFSEEVRLNISDLGPFEGFFGGSVFSARNGLDFDLGYNERAMALLLDGTLQRLAPRGLTNGEIESTLGVRAAGLKPFHGDRQLTRATVTTFDLFADMTVHLHEGFDIFAGGRVTRDRKKVSLQGLTPYGVSTITRRGLLLQPTPNNAVLTDSNSATTLTGRGGIRYAVGPAVNVYATYGIGKRPEVLQPSPTGPWRVVPTETLKSAEVGMKWRLAGGRIVGDMSVYRYDYDNFQTQILRDGAIATTNAGKADATGAEAQINASLVKGMSVFGSYGYNHGRLRSGRYAGNRFRNSPDHKYAIGANLEAVIGNDRIAIAPIYSWQSKMFFGDDNDRTDLQQRTPTVYADRVQDEFQKGFGMLGARISFTGNDDRWNFALIGDNLLDTKYVVDAGNLGDGFGIPTFIAGTRRAIRVEFGVRF